MLVFECFQMMGNETGITYDHSGGLNQILLGVHVTIDPLRAGNRGTRCARLRSSLREEVRGDEGPCDTWIETSPSVVSRVDYGVLESTGVLQTEMDLALLGLVGLLGGRADVSLEGIKAKCHDLVAVSMAVCF